MLELLKDFLKLKTIQLTKKVSTLMSLSNRELPTSITTKLDNSQAKFGPAMPHLLTSLLTTLQISGAIN